MGGQHAWKHRKGLGGGGEGYAYMHEGGGTLRKKLYVPRVQKGEKAEGKAMRRSVGM